MLSCLRRSCLSVLLEGAVACLFANRGLSHK
jgi:hypothetical protein